MLLCFESHKNKRKTEVVIVKLVSLFKCETTYSHADTIEEVKTLCNFCNILSLINNYKEARNNHLLFIYLQNIIFFSLRVRVYKNVKITYDNI